MVSGDQIYILIILCTDAHQMAYVFFCSIEGAVMFARAERSEEPMQIVIKHCKNLVKQISN